MTDSLDAQLRDIRRDPRPDEAYRLTFNVATDEGLARPRSEAKPPNLLASPFFSPRAGARSSARNSSYSQRKRFFYGCCGRVDIAVAIAGFSLLPHGSTPFSELPHSR